MLEEITGEHFKPELPDFNKKTKLNGRENTFA